MMMTSWHRSGHHVTHGLHSVFYSRAVVALCIGFLVTIATATPPTNSVTDATDSTTPIGDEFKILMEDSLTFFDDIMNTLEEEGQGQDNSGEDATVPPPSSPAEGLTPYLPRLNSGTNPVPGPKPGPKPAPKALEGTTPYLTHSVSSTDPVPEPKPAPTPATTPAPKTTEGNTPYLPRLIPGADPVPGTKPGPDPAPKPVPKKTEENTPYLPHMPSGENPFPGPGETPKTPKWVDSPIPFLRGKATVLPSQHETSTPTTDPKRTPTSGPWNPNQSKQRTSLSGGQSPIGGVKLSHRTLIIVLVSVGIVVMLLVFFLFSIIFYRNRKAVEQTSSLRSMPIRVGHLPDISAFEWGEASASSGRSRTQSLMSAFLFPSDPPCASNSVVLANAYLDDGIHFNANDLMTINHASEDFQPDTKVIDLSILDDEEQPANASYVIDRPFQMYLQDADEQSDSDLLGGTGNLDVTQVTFSPTVEIEGQSS